MNSVRPLKLADIYGRTRRVGDCLVWTGPASNESPQVRHAKRYVPCRRVVLELSGVAIPAGQYPVNWCRTPLCICRKHLSLMTTKQIGELAAREGKFATVERRRAITEGRRRSGKNMKLNLEKVADIKACANSVIAAEKHGVDPALTARIRRGEAWRDVSQLQPSPPPCKVQVIPSKPGKYDLAGDFERAISADWAQRRQAERNP